MINNSRKRLYLLQCKNHSPSWGLGVKIANGMLYKKVSYAWFLLQKEC